MSTLENREKALQFAVAIATIKPQADWAAAAVEALNFLETGAFASDESAKAAPEAPKVTRSRKDTPAPAAAAPEKSAVTTVEPATPAVQAPVTEAVAVTATSPSKEPTLDDVRAALVALQTRKGTKAPAQMILEKYSPTKVTGGLKKQDYAKVIAECAAA